MEWSQQQDRGLVAVKRWLDDPGGQQIFRLFGFAGTGKTTLAKHLAEGVDGLVLFAAFTGKATSVLQASGAVNAQTLHSLIYNPKNKSQERLGELKIEFTGLKKMMRDTPEEEWQRDWKDRHQKLGYEIDAEEKNLKRPDFSLNLESILKSASLLVVDECSMVDEDMAMDILQFNVPVLVLGDPAQLPPVRGTGYFTNAKPDVMLTEIHRQARDNPIIELATRVRNGETLHYGQYGLSSVLERADPELAMSSDQIIVGKNTTRISTNRRMRSLLGFNSRFPLLGEKLLCLRNDRELGLLNGTLHTSASDSEEIGWYVNLHIVPEDYPGTAPQIIPAHIEHFYGDPDQIGYWERRNAQEFTFGYALTCHKSQGSQGSQWGKVLIIDESAVFRSADVQRKWLYTAITRAAERVTIARPV